MVKHCCLFNYWVTTAEQYYNLFNFFSDHYQVRNLIFSISLRKLLIVIRNFIKKKSLSKQTRSEPVTRIMPKINIPTSMVPDTSKSGTELNLYQQMQKSPHVNFEPKEECKKGKGRLAYIYRSGNEAESGHKQTQNESIL